MENKFILDGVDDNISPEIAYKINKKFATLEYLGCHIIKSDTKEIGLIDVEISYFFTVPESSTIDVDKDNPKNEYYKTSEGLVELTKEYIFNSIELYIRDIYTYRESEEDIEDMVKYFKDHVKYFAKTKKGLVWNAEMGKKCVDKFIKSAKDASEFKEV